MCCNKCMSCFNGACDELPAMLITYLGLCGEKKRKNIYKRHFSMRSYSVIHKTLRRGSQFYLQITPSMPAFPS